MISQLKYFVFGDKFITFIFSILYENNKTVLNNKSILKNGIGNKSFNNYKWSIHQYRAKSVFN